MRTAAALATFALRLARKLGPSARLADGATPLASTYRMYSEQTRRELGLPAVSAAPWPHACERAAAADVPAIEAAAADIAARCLRYRGEFRAHFVATYLQKVLAHVGRREAARQQPQVAAAAIEPHVAMAHGLGLLDTCGQALGLLAD